jgi:hypothetical protein
VGKDDFEWQSVIKALDRYDKTLLVLSLSDEVTVAFCFLNHCRKLEGVYQVKADSLIACLFSNSFGYAFPFHVGIYHTIELGVTNKRAVLNFFHGSRGNTLRWNLDREEQT